MGFQGIVNFDSVGALCLEISLGCEKLCRLDISVFRGDDNVEEGS